MHLQIRLSQQRASPSLFSPSTRVQFQRFERLLRTDGEVQNLRNCPAIHTILLSARSFDEVEGTCQSDLHLPHTKDVIPTLSGRDKITTAEY